MAQNPAGSTLDAQAIRADTADALIFATLADALAGIVARPDGVGASREIRTALAAALLEVEHAARAARAALMPDGPPPANDDQPPARAR
jgi:hypothetical protein